MPHPHPHTSRVTLPQQSTAVPVLLGPVLTVYPCATCPMPALLPQAKAQEAAWKAALARAAGEKVLDDPKLLRKSLKREMKRKEKHGKAWKVRAEKSIILILIVQRFIRVPGGAGCRGDGRAGSCRQGVRGCVLGAVGRWRGVVCVWGWEHVWRLEVAGRAVKGKAPALTGCSKLACADGHCGALEVKPSEVNTKGVRGAQQALSRAWLVTPPQRSTASPWEHSRDSTCQQR